MLIYAGKGRGEGGRGGGEWASEENESYCFLMQRATIHTSRMNILSRRGAARYRSRGARARRGSIVTSWSRS